MAWQAHLETGAKALLTQVRKQLGRLKLHGTLIPESSRRNLARGLIASRLNYLQPLWGGAPEAYIRKAQVVLNSAARWATGLSKRTKISKLMALNQRAGKSLYSSTDLENCPSGKTSKTS